MSPVKSLTYWLGSWARLACSRGALSGVVAFGAAGFCLVEGCSAGDSLY